METAGRVHVKGLLLARASHRNVAHPADLDLARRAANHDESAWQKIYDLTRERLFALLIYHCGRREEALELLQETYLCAIKSLGRYRGEGPLVSWFAVIAIRRARDWKRRLVRWRRQFEMLKAEQQADVSSNSDHDTGRALREALRCLGERQRAAFLLRELDGLRFREIGRALACRESTARVHFHRARMALKGVLARQGFSPKRKRSGESGSPSGEGTARSDGEPADGSLDRAATTRTSREGEMQS